MSRKSDRTLTRGARAMRRQADEALPPDGTSRVLATLPTVATPAPVRRTRRAALAAAGSAAAAALLVVTVPAALRPRPSLAASSVVDALRRAETWHFQGWKEVDGRRVPWEVWGRRSPFLFYERIGSELTVDDGRVRTLVLPPARSEAGDSAPPLVLRLPSRQGGAGDFGSSHSDLLRRWLAAGERPEEVASATAVFRFRDEMDADLLGARDFLYTVDRRTALPVEYRLRRGGAAGRVVEHLEMSYGMPIPASVAAAPRPPAGATVVDAADDAAWGRLPGSGAPPPVGPNVVTAGPLTVAAEPAATDAAGAVLVRFRTWVGEVALRPPTGTVPLYPKFTTPSTRHSGQDTAPFCVDDRGRAYVWAQGWTAPRSASPDYEAVWLLAPAEPLPPGAPMPRALTLRGEASLMTPVAMPGAKGWKTERVLLNENFTWRIPLSARPAGLPSHDEEEQRRNVASPPEAPIAEARAFHWMRVADSGGGGAAQAAGRRAAEWLERAIRSYGGNGARVPMLQLLLARQYDRLGERERAAELARRVLADTAPSNPNHRQAAELLEGLEKAAK